MNLQRRGVQVDFIPHEESTVTVEAVERTLRPETRLLSVSWVQFLSGFRADLEAIGRLCRARDVVFCVDAIQGLGALELDVEAAGIDALACGGHKWLMAPQGTGLLYVSEKLQDRLHPPAGWRHGPVDWENFFDYRLQFHPDARRYEGGTMNHLGIAALDAALGLYLDTGTAWCEGQVLERARTLADGLADLGLQRYGSAEPDHASGIVTVRPPEPEALYEHLERSGVRAAMRNRLLRFSPAYYQTPAEMERVVEVVAGFEVMDEVEG